MGPLLAVIFNGARNPQRRLAHHIEPEPKIPHWSVMSALMESQAVCVMTMRVIRRSSLAVTCFSPSSWSLDGLCRAAAAIVVAAARGKQAAS